MFREQLAELCHEQWSGWMKYLFSKGYYSEGSNYETTQIAWLMPPSFVERWQRQMNTEYDLLSEEEKDSDRKEADKFIAIMENQIKGVFYAGCSIGMSPSYDPEKFDKEWETYKKFNI